MGGLPGLRGSHRQCRCRTATREVLRHALREPDSTQRGRWLCPLHGPVNVIVRRWEFPARREGDDPTWRDHGEERYDPA